MVTNHAHEKIMIRLGRNTQLNGYSSLIEKSTKCSENPKAGMANFLGEVKQEGLGILEWDLEESLERIFPSRGQACALVQQGER